MKRLVVLVVFLFTFGLILPVFAADDAWRIGVILPTSGPNSKNGIKNFDGIKIATDMINDAGGVLGRKVVLVTADAPDPQAAASEANRLITNEKITAIMGTQASSLAMAATVVAEKNKVFYLENEAVSGLITARGFKYLVRTTFSGQMFAYQMVDFTAGTIAEKMGKEPQDLKLAIIHEDGGFGTSTGKALTDRVKELGLNLVATETYSAKSADLSGMILKLKMLKPDVVLAAQYINDAILFHPPGPGPWLQELYLRHHGRPGQPGFLQGHGPGRRRGSGRGHSGRYLHRGPG